MECEFAYCIYNRNSKCLLSKVGINSLGMCEECIIVSLENDFLEQEKMRQFEEIEHRWRPDIKE